MYYVFSIEFLQALKAFSAAEIDVYDCLFEKSICDSLSVKLLLIKFLLGLLFKPIGLFDYVSSQFIIISILASERVFIAEEFGIFLLHYSSKSDSIVLFCLFEYYSQLFKIFSLLLNIAVDSNNLLPLRILVLFVSYDFNNLFIPNVT